jgi:hypothetical protein
MKQNRASLGRKYPHDFSPFWRGAHFFFSFFPHFFFLGKSFPFFLLQTPGSSSGDRGSIWWKGA